jgi:hypothetical protein
MFCLSLKKTTIWKALAQGRILYLCHILKAMKSGKGDALRKEQGIFCILFVAAWTKRMASGGTRPAGSGFAFRLLQTWEMIATCMGQSLWLA